MELEKKYTAQADPKKLKLLGQYFTPKAIAKFMAAWATDGRKRLLDPAVGNGVFFNEALKINPKLNVEGFEIDKEILDYFNPSEKDRVQICDFLESGWNEKYDAIICNPPYNRFQRLKNRQALFENFKKETGLNVSGYTNQYILFLIKSIYQMSDNGRLAFIIPSEFLNSKYGSDVKQLLLDQQLLKAIVSFDSNVGVFNNAVTTSCIVLLDKQPKSSAFFIKLNGMNELEELQLDSNGVSLPKERTVDYSVLKNIDKWRSLLNNETQQQYRHTVELNKYAKVTRGIATGDNKYFLFTKNMIKALDIPIDQFDKVIAKSADIQGPKFKQSEYRRLVDSNKMIYLFNPTEIDDSGVAAYLKKGVQEGVSSKYLCSHRTPWYRAESKAVAPIWISQASRNGLKIIRNETQFNNLTTFHSLRMHKEYEHLTNVFFCYLLTPLAQNIILQNKKEMGNGLIKYQPNDLNYSEVADLDLLTDVDINKINKIYKTINSKNRSLKIEEIENIFSKYLAPAI